ncbi:MAG: hypothetical protein JW819_00420 [Candidatus Krumholzibacteriota bacterium]|nr:hypothetical protein [Candidatus Krumholzibacteriota bacterium]
MRRRRLALAAALAAATALALIAGPASATSATNRDILIDGDSSDFAADETVFHPSEELAFDSWWGENNDINQLHVSWDSLNIYVAVDGRCWDNNIMLFLDSDPLGGIEDADRLNSWRRKLFFFGHRPDSFFGTWDNNTDPQYWRLRAGASSQVDQVTVDGTYIKAKATFSQGRPGASMEVALAWASLYPSAVGTVPAGAEVALVAVLVTGADGLSGPDCAPNNTIGMPANSGDQAFINNFAILAVDRDLDGKPDLGVAPAGRTGDAFGDEPPLRFVWAPDAPQVQLKFLQMEALRRAFSPDGDGIEDQAEVRFRLSTDAPVTVRVYDPLGRRVRHCEQFLAGANKDYLLTWDGRDDSDRPVAAGVYLMRFQAGFSDRVNLPLAVLR